MYIKKEYTGCWKDEYGKKLVIRFDKKNFYTDFYINNTDTVKRNLLGDLIVESINMKSFYNGKYLTVELGNEGLGPTLKLEYKSKDRGCLIPIIECGLYDDWQDDFGVPWLFPLAIFYKT